MDTQHETHPGHGLTLHQLLHALNAELLAQTTSGQLASDLSEVWLKSTHSVLTPPSYTVLAL
jgi:hypothetical protein